MTRILWYSFVGFLCFLPFQKTFWIKYHLPRKFLWSDEVFVSILTLLCIIIFPYRPKINRKSFYILVLLGGLVVIGFVSGVYNQNPMIVTVNGVFDYVKNFLPAGILGFFLISKYKLQTLYRVLYRISILIGIIASIQIGLYYAGLLPPVEVRFGLPRVRSLMSHPNIMGLYCLLFFFLEFTLHERFRFKNIFLLIPIIFSVSRMVWIAFIAGMGYMAIMHFGKKRFVGYYLFGSIILTMIILGRGYFLKHTTQEVFSTGYFRGYAFSKSLEIWGDHPVLGVGPGRYGGIISFVFPSPVYEKYNFSKHWYNYMSNFRSLDQFWVQLLAEMGIIGFLLFWGLLFCLWYVSYRKFRCTKDDFIKGISLGLSAIPIVMMVYLFGSGLNLAPFLLTYSVLLGMTLGVKIL